jgi:hypothetical protein
MTDVIEKTFHSLKERLPGRVSRPGNDRCLAAAAIWATPGCCHFDCVADWTSSGVWQCTTARVGQIMVTGAISLENRCDAHWKKKR